MAAGKKPCAVAGCQEPRRAREWCQRHYNAWYRSGGDPLAFKVLCGSGVCVVGGCGARARSNAAGALCEKHYYRHRRTGSLHIEERVPQPVIQQGHGAYLLLYAADHPLRKSGQRVYEHRAVFYDAHGEGPFRCHWCSRWVGWSGMHVDHRDGDRTNNALPNLVAACVRCNTSRQGVNKRGNAVGLTFNGETLSVAGWARRVGVSPQSIHYRLRRGWPIERALTETRGRFGPKAERQLTMFDLPTSEARRAKHPCHNTKTAKARAERRLT